MLSYKVCTLGQAYVEDSGFCDGISCVAVSIK